MQDSKSHRNNPRKTNDSRLATLRMERGLTQQQLADLIGCKRLTVARWESGQCTPSMMAAKNASAALGCKLDDLI